jgi:hypothetical protein
VTTPQNGQANEVDMDSSMAPGAPLGSQVNIIRKRKVRHRRFGAPFSLTGRGGIDLRQIDK